MPSLTLGESAPDRAVGQVEWRFKCIWGASGEEDADPASGSGSPQPWWNPVPPSGPSQSSSPTSLFYSRRNPLDTRIRTRPRTRSDAHTHHDDNDAYPDKSNERYRIARRQHPNVVFGLGTGAKLGDRYWSVLPEHVRGQLGTESGWDQGFGYEGIPSGWWCDRCGRVNYQALLRMRWCVGQRCLVGCHFRGLRRSVMADGDCVVKTEAMRAEKGPIGFAVPLDVLRDPMQVMPVTHAMDTYPDAGSVRGVLSVWADGMRTFSYVVHEAGGGFVRAGITSASALTSSAYAPANPNAPAAASISVASTSTSAVYTPANPDAPAAASPSTTSNPDTYDATGAPVDAGVAVKHIFTGNIRSLQAGATDLLLEVQKTVPLRRTIGESGRCPFACPCVSADKLFLSQARTFLTLFHLVFMVLMLARL